MSSKQSRVRGVRTTPTQQQTFTLPGGTTNKGQTIQVGDIVKDMNSTWPRYQCEGVVTSTKGNMITWRDNKTGDMLQDPISDLIKQN